MTTKNSSWPRQLIILTFLLFCMSSLSRLATSIYLPALPAIGADLNIEETLLGLSLTFYLLGFAVCTLIAGPLSDAFGRRNIILSGTVIFLIGTLFCGLAQGGITLLCGRLLQAMGACSIPVTCRAVVRDAFDDQQVIKVVGWLGVLGAIIPTLAPIIGGALTQFLGWRYNFFFLATVTVFALLIALKNFPETLPLNKRQPLSLVIILKRFSCMLKTREFLLVMLPVVFCFALQGVYFACSPFALIKQLHLTPTQYGATNICLVLSLVAGRFSCSVLVNKLGNKKTYLTVGFLMLFVGICFAGLFVVTFPSIFQLLFPASLFGLGFGILAPLGVKEALTLFRHQSGSVSALYGCITLGASGLFSAIAGGVMDLGVSPVHTMAGLSSICCLCVLVTTILFFYTRGNAAG